MAFAFEKRESPRDGAVRLAHEGVGLALEWLEGAAKGDPVHETRKILKRLRAVVRVCRGAIGKRAYRESNAALREAGRTLSSARDAAVVRITLESLAKRQGAPPGVEAVASIFPEVAPLSADAAHDAAVHVRAFRDQIDRWRFDEEGFDVVRDGLHAGYRDGRRALADADEDWAPEAVHELRKRVKDLRYEIELFENAWPEMFGPLAKVLDDLGDDLGEDHDLSVLMEQLRASALRPDVVQPWLDVAEQRRAKLRKRAVPIATRIYAEKPKAFVARIEGWYGDR